MGDQCLGPGNCPSSGRYLEQSEQADSFAFNNRMNLILFAAGNDGDQADETDKKVSPPATVKNILTVGASEIYLEYFEQIELFHFQDPL